MKTRRAFTLIELLVVIAIISIVAAMVVNMNTRAQNVKRNTMVNADKARLTLAINTYQSKLNFYPPDNGNLISNTLANYAANYDGWASTNPLLYELTGATNNYLTDGHILVFDNSIVDASTTSSPFESAFARSAIANASMYEPHNFFQPPPKEYANYSPTLPLNVLSGLLVPVTLSDPGVNNFWHYDSSSPNRHNLSSYDLWAEYVTGSQSGSNIITTNGNW
jgi:prepilin-type N-terminal cleavage/methylation domain-containing protein